MENRMEKTFSGLREENKKGLIGYITAGDPNLDFLKSLLKAMEDGGADVIEIGVPFSDPLADGPVIQKAAQRALKNGFSVDKLFDTLKDIRKEVSTPLVFLVYYNTIFAYGEEKFIEKCAACGIDGLIIPDLPLEEQEVLKADLKKVNMSLIPLVAPTSEERIKNIVDDASGFVYCVTSLGVTGVRSEFSIDLRKYIEKIRKNTTLPLCLGFGIGDVEKAKEFSVFADGIIIGSVLVKKVEEIGKGEATIVDLRNLVKSFKDAIL
ncbi:tryptophan synthase alpha chain [Clostridium polyendosporum]|uniref:Tryptophan synthase alpha chain n=1 Tax=Clostridium polyendosporum TaxID=69208 RepID=A0A919VHL1_9CLOT|nr:tryptophan synthase subunit alpha [Clostridium polyendosporum]GIM29806.1 tryptophan synthase alpha chain [Clostridium polyendosporum]